MATARTKKKITRKKTKAVKAPATPEEEKSPFDEAAELAEQAIEGNLDDMTGREVAEWWMEHFGKAGHKRLGRILVKQAKA